MAQPQSVNKIHLLPDSVANQIAAGEVIQRPASVVKELVENAIDAGATSVDIVIRDAGRTLIQVIDNGCGMNEIDARFAFERHATSKISSADDLFTLHTMGFRGEALPSIAAVSEVDLRTVQSGDTMGTQLVISASELVEQHPYVGTPGTSVAVKRLFFNLPARRRFLKKDAIEFGHIAREFERLALVNVNVDLSLVHNDVTVHKLMRAPLKRRISDLFGQNFDHTIIPLTATDTSICSISGYIGLPQNARKRGALQFFFVNGRNMKHSMFHRALMSVYEPLIPAGAMPNYFINIDVDPATIDVNIHPQKHEIKFENELPVRQILVAAIKQALGSFNAVPSIDFDRDDAPDIPVFSPGEVPTTMPGICTGGDGYNPFDTPGRNNNQGNMRSANSMRPTTSRGADWDQLYRTFFGEAPMQTDGAGVTHASATPNIDDIPVEESASPVLPGMEAMQEVPMLLCINGRFIVAPSHGGLMVIDYRRAHINILYHKYMSQFDAGQQSSQRVMFAEPLTLDPTRNMVLSSILPMLGSIGFDIRPGKGKGQWTIQGVPTPVATAAPNDLLLDIINEVSDGDMDDSDVAISQWQRIALSMARTTALKRGKRLSQIEMENIMADLFKTPTPNLTPDGHTVFATLSAEDLAKNF